MPTFSGPTFCRVEEVAGETFDFAAFRARDHRPVVVKGAVTRWPELHNWTFGHLAAMCDRRPEGVTVPCKNGLIEQGSTRPEIMQPLGPYLRELDRQARLIDDAPRALVAHRELSQLAPSELFHLDWSRLDFIPDKAYLQQFDLFSLLPELKNDVPRKTLWPGAHATWAYVFIGPADTLTGLHFDFSHNWFCQVRGTKEVLLFDQTESSRLSPGDKYDWGSVLSDLDLSRLETQSGPRDRFAEAHGTYARLEAGDAIFIPRRTWHAIVALTPSISVGVFGLTPFEIAGRGTALTAGKLLHLARLYRRGNCACHPNRA